MWSHYPIQARCDGVRQCAVAEPIAGGGEQIRMALVIRGRMVIVSYEIAEKYLLVRRQLIINTRNILLLFAVVRQCERIPSAAVGIEGWIDGRDHSQDLQ